MNNLRQLAKYIHQGNKDRGFYDNTASKETRVLLIVSEVVKCMEADRKGNWCSVKNISDYTKLYDFFRESEKINNTGFIESQFKVNIKDTVQDELADVFIRLLDFAEYENSVMPEEIRSESVNWFKDNHKGETLANSLYYLVDRISDLGPEGVAKEEAMDDCIHLSYAIARIHKIDLPFHVEHKLKYNATRGHKHGGKKY